jgi:NodT family efflux transporter outer membrane factor (OMF) lipoprotein
MKSYKNITFLIFVVLIWSACKVPQPLQPDMIKPLPNNFADSKDTVNTAVLSWKTFFTDPNLTALIGEAIENNLDVLAISQKIAMANADVKSAQGATRPVASAVFAPAVRRFGLYTMDGAGNASTDILDGKRVPTHLPDFFVGAQMTWEADIWHKLKNRKQAAILRYLATAEGRNVVITNLIAEIALLYYDLLALDNQIIMLREAIALQENALAIVRIQKEAGVANELAIKQFEAQVFNIKNLEIQTLQNIIEIENKINFLLGRYPQPITRSNINFLEYLPPSVQVGIPAQLLRNRPDIKAAELQLLANQADVAAARAAFYPTVTLTGSLGMQAFNPILLASPKSLAYNVLGGLVAPIFNKSALEATYLNATATQREAFFEYQKSILNGVREVNSEMAKMNYLVQQQNFKNQEVNALRQAIDISNELFKVGRANYLELLTAQQNTLTARLDLITIKQQQVGAIINLYKALGGGWQ